MKGGLQGESAKATLSGLPLTSAVRLALPAAVPSFLHEATPPIRKMNFVFPNCPAYYRTSVAIQRSNLE